jgi:lipopolysaccharide transport system permease protein
MSIDAAPAGNSKTPAAAGQEIEIPFFRIERTRTLSFTKLKELWAYRELVYFLVWRDIKVRYKQTVLGAAWAVIQPLFMMIVLSLFVARLINIPLGGIPYPLFAYCGLVPWTLFSHALVESSNSLIANERLITKAYFPRLIIPLASVIAGLPDFAIAFLVLIAMILYYGIALTPAILLLPLFIVLALMTALGAGLCLSALNVQYRDVRYTLAFLTQIWLFATPVAYPSSVVSHSRLLLYGLNPMAGVVEGFRWTLLGQTSGSAQMLLVSAGAAILLLIFGFYYFHRLEKTFADVV